ncbi:MULTISPECIES: hypothetical protein [unclassified Empedobacter]|uniref:hypothetical protein n=1 Tax=unclassified Empedobacter TaxID=2643773 RepID=UPI0025C10090|nr:MULTISPECIES: hypothetical protein [unclassified Empedobacter]
MTTTQKKRICDILNLSYSTKDDEVLYSFIEYVIEYLEKQQGSKVNQLKSQPLNSRPLTQEEQKSLSLKLGIDPNHFGLKSQKMTFYT